MASPSTEASTEGVLYRLTSREVVSRDVRDESTQVKSLEGALKSFEPLDKPVIVLGVLIVSPESFVDSVEGQKRGAEGPAAVIDNEYSAVDC